MTTGGAIVRMLVCFMLVFATWNPTGVSYVDWITGPASLAEKALATAVLIALHLLFWRITWLSLGLLGLAFLLAMLTLGVFTLSELEVIDLGQRRTRSYMFLSVAAVTLAVGLLWSLMKRRVTGQSNYLNPPP